jgi:hypothetical protein
MKFKILHAFVTAKNSELIDAIIEHDGAEELQYFCWRFLVDFPQLDLSYLEEIYAEDKENTKGMLLGVYDMLIYSNHTNYKDFVCDPENYEE